MTPSWMLARLLDGMEQVVTAPVRVLLPVQTSAHAQSRRERADAYYVQFGPAVYRRCLRLLRDPDAAKDATQEIFIKLLREMDRFEDRAAALRWTYRVTTNHCLNMLRDRQYHETNAGPADLEIHGGETCPDYPTTALAHQVLARFDAQTQAIAVGVFVDGMKHEEVADALGISRRTVSRKLERFLENARKFLTRSDE